MSAAKWLDAAVTRFAFLLGVLTGALSVVLDAFLLVVLFNVVLVATAYARYRSDVRTGR